MKTFACKTMAYFDRWVALMKANDDATAKKLTSPILVTAVSYRKAMK
jgi:hypothetical protein